MSINQENLALVKEEFRRKNLRAKEEAGERMRELEAKFPELERVHKRFIEIGERMIGSALDRKMTVEERLMYIEGLKDEASRLSLERAALLEKNGYPASYTDPRYECSVCNDTGYVNSVMCTCMRKALVKKGYESSGIGRLLENQSFDTFSFEFYSDKSLELAKLALSACKGFAEGFTKETKSMLLIGGTGLGKTHLCTSVAKTVIEKGYDVIYESAGNVFHAFESERFGGRREEYKKLTDRYLECDLLILDDLGTELGGQFINHCLYLLINERLNKRLPTLISSNLSDPNDMRSRYNDRIVSRILGEYSVFKLTGTDVRSQKLKKKRG